LVKDRDLFHTPFYITTPTGKNGCEYFCAVSLTIETDSSLAGGAYRLWKKLSVNAQYTRITDTRTKKWSQ